MKIVVDVNLPPSWEDALGNSDVEAIHWSRVGPLDAKDREIMQWAKEHEHVVFTHDLDFSAILAATQADRPSVIQIRTSNVLPATLEPHVSRALRRYRQVLAEGAIVSVDLSRSRARILPLSS